VCKVYDKQTFPDKWQGGGMIMTIDRYVKLDAKKSKKEYSQINGRENARTEGQ